MSASSREIVAIMFTDVRGYSALSQTDEALAMRLLETKRRIADPLIERYRGRLIKTIGDALMVEFHSALDAVRCATEIQQQLHSHNEQVEPLERITIRIGLHMGDVMRIGDDIFGDTVNIAARVEPRAEPGGVAMTQAVYDQVRTKFAEPLVLMGSFDLKGISEPMALYSVALSWTASAGASSRPAESIWTRLGATRIAQWTLAYAATAWLSLQATSMFIELFGGPRWIVRVCAVLLASGVPLTMVLAWNASAFGRRRLAIILGVAVVSVAAIVAASVSRLDRLSSPDGLGGTGAAIAVLRFDDLRASKATDHAVERIQAQLLDSLTLIGGVRPVPLASLGRVVGSGKSLREIGAELGADYVITGSIKDDERGASITVQMVETTREEPMFTWSGVISGRKEQADLWVPLGSEVAGRVRFMLQPDDWLAAGYPTTKDPAAWALFRQAVISMDMSDAMRAATLLDEAIGRDPNFAQARALRAASKAGEVGSDTSGVTRAAVLADLKVAEAVAPGLPEARLARAWLVEWTEHAPDKGLAILKDVAAPLDGSYQYHMAAAHAYRGLGREQDALRELERALAIAPYSWWPVPHIGYLRFHLRHYDAARAFVALEQERWPNSSLLAAWKLLIDFAQTGDLERYSQGVDDWIAHYQIGKDDERWWRFKIELAIYRRHYDEALGLVRTMPGTCLDSFTWTNHREWCRDNLVPELLTLSGRTAEARASAASYAVALDHAIAKPDAPYTPATAPWIRGRLYAISGDRARAIKVIAPFLEYIESDNARPEHNLESNLLLHDLAITLAWAGDTDRSLKLLQRSLDVPFGAEASMVAIDPVWQPMHADARFRRLLAERGFPLKEGTK